MSGNDKIAIISKPVNVSVCPLCNSKFMDMAGAKSCFAKGQAIAHLEKIYKLGCFLHLIVETKKIIIPVEKMIIAKCKSCSCIGSYAFIKHLDSNDETEIGSQSYWLTAEIISVFDAVTKYGWRVAYKDVWKIKAPEAIRVQYLHAIEKVVLNMTSEEKEFILMNYEAFLKPRNQIE